MSDRLPYQVSTYRDTSGPRHCVIDAKGKLLAVLEPGQPVELARKFAAMPEMLAACELLVATWERIGPAGFPTAFDTANMAVKKAAGQ